jgi:hypothetical protein
MTSPDSPGGTSEMRRSYVRVIIVWVVTLAALYAFPKLFA